MTDTMRVCSKHFEESAFHIQRDLSSRPRKTNLRRRNLKRNAVPTKNLPTGTHDNTKKKERRNLNRCDPVQHPMLQSDCEQMREIQDENECLCCRVRCYSHYKENNTVKFMVAVTPAGLISYASEAYGGQASDKIIIEQSDLISCLKPNEDAIMVDRGFLIDEICFRNGIKLIRPFMRSRKQMSSRC